MLIFKREFSFQGVQCNSSKHLTGWPLGILEHKPICINRPRLESEEMAIQINVNTIY